VSIPSPVSNTLAADISSILPTQKEIDVSAEDNIDDDEEAAETSFMNMPTQTFNILVISVGCCVVVLFIVCGCVMYARYKRVQKGKNRKRVVNEMHHGKDSESNEMVNSNMSVKKKTSSKEVNGVSPPVSKSSQKMVYSESRSGGYQRPMQSMPVRQIELQHMDANAVQLQIVRKPKRAQLDESDEDEEEMEMMYDDKIKIESEAITAGSTTTGDDGQLQNVDRIVNWLMHAVQVPRECVSKYVGCFVSNGFETLQRIREIENESQLKEIGIQSTAHQVMLMVHILQLKQLSSVDVLRVGIPAQAKVRVENTDESDDEGKPADDNNVLLSAAERHVDLDNVEYGNILAATPQPPDLQQDYQVTIS